MARAAPPPKPKKELSAPFFMLTYGDMMTLLLCFFVLLFAMSTIEISKFQAQVSVMQGSLGISKLYQHAPMQQNLPAPSVKVPTRILSHSEVSPTETQSKIEETAGIKTPLTQEDEETMGRLHTLGIEANLDIRTQPDELVIIIPSHGIFDSDSYEIDPSSPEVQRLEYLYDALALQIAALCSYDITFTGHTDAIPLKRKKSDTGPKTNMELGFVRAMTIYDHFFQKRLKDKTRITFASQGDNVPIIPNATLDSELRKNRRVEIHLKKSERFNK